VSQLVFVSEYFRDQNRFVCECYSSHKQLEAQILYENLSKKEILIEQPKSSSNTTKLLLMCGFFFIVASMTCFPKPCFSAENNNVPNNTVVPPEPEPLPEPEQEPHQPRLRMRVFVPRPLSNLSTTSAEPQQTLRLRGRVIARQLGPVSSITRPPRLRMRIFPGGTAMIFPAGTALPNEQTLLPGTPTPGTPSRVTPGTPGTTGTPTRGGTPTSSPTSSPPPGSPNEVD